MDALSQKAPLNSSHVLLRMFLKVKIPLSEPGPRLSMKCNETERASLDRFLQQSAEPSPAIIYVVVTFAREFYCSKVF